VFTHDPGVVRAAVARVSAGFSAARHAAATGAERPAVDAAFRGALGSELPAAMLGVLHEAAFPLEAEDLSARLVSDALADLVVADRTGLPDDGRGVRIISVDGASRHEWAERSADTLLGPAEARERVASRLETAGAGVAPELAEASAAVARALVVPNLVADRASTEEAALRASMAVSVPLETVKRGAIVFRTGDTLTPRQVAMYRELQAHQGAESVVVAVVVTAVFLLVLILAVTQFAAAFLPAFTMGVREVTTAGALLVAVSWAGRAVVAASDGVAGWVGFDAQPQSVWYVAPIPAATLLVRLLLGVSWSLSFAVVAAVATGLAMQLAPAPTVYFLVTGVAAAGAVHHTQERLSVLRAGVFVAGFGAVFVLVLHFLQLFVLEGEVSLAATLRPVWSMAFAATGGVLSASLVLAALPAFEMLGFVTDYRLMELANINHPLLRHLLQRAPGSYHHSVNVGTLAEAGCEAIGANGLRARVAAYFHDIGKAVEPQFFAENQLDRVNRHDGLDPLTSARVIIRHVVDGARMAREHRLPEVIVDNIFMHHGTGLLTMFYERARAAADAPERVKEADFRYPGPRPSTREAGVIMLADKVEAATRTLAVPDERNLRLMITRVINSSMADGQLSECPLTVREIHNVHEVFVRVLLGFYHQRVEYPATADLSRAGGSSQPAPSATITLELPAPTPPPTLREPDGEDYESVQHLPRGDA
jgi:putative nucleotidyltransferase with HDIG domain